MSASTFVLATNNLFESGEAFPQVVRQGLLPAVLPPASFETRIAPIEAASPQPKDQDYKPQKSAKTDAFRK
jgi:hypothetical protein